MFKVYSTECIGIKKKLITQNIFRQPNLNTINLKCQAKIKI